MTRAAPYLGVAKLNAAIVAWPHANRIETRPDCVSAIYTDVGMTRTGSVINSITDQETAYGAGAWSPSGLSYDEVLQAFSATTGVGQSNALPNIGNLYGAAGNSAVPTAYIVRCKELGIYDLFGTFSSFSFQNYIQISSTQVRYIAFRSSSGNVTCTFNHGLDTSITRTWIVNCNNTFTNSISVYADGVFLGSSGPGVGTGYDSGTSNARLRIGGAVGYNTKFYAAGYFLRNITPAEFG